ncbi:hypothetical protein AW40_07300 [Kosakonia radicincitans UMEnt01/12]|uniref:hypothetical protein n=1 Tax=Kosakonia radicincitans TaxID=283686 RepID=UPI0004618F9E|nr:hypothetical protein [Kosakonia radicincitans]KDE37443.1 hypothetical protein AW40_07300 [Kosakonia radicincitans UMEnt01/12]
MTEIIYTDRTKHEDDGCDYTAVILWQMNAGARARSRSAYVPPPRPVQVVKPRVATKATAKAKKATPETSATRFRKTHTAVVIRSDGQHTVKIRETATVWTAGSKENYDKKTGHRVGTRGRCRMLLETITPIESAKTPADEPKDGDLSAQKLVALMKGKTLSYQAILAAIAKHHPGVKMSLQQLQRRVFGMMKSNYVGITRHDDMPVPHFTLTSVDPRFYVHSEKNTRA